ncbi:hypothetical protein [Saccharicrinis fermentans]|uniref:hypothetical protein n=1 Tax=Saccharicrinis fermentans TaxID=982 RepID=UPI0004B8BFCB|nr:hypothetical protein [Saccharicrinis fermentans]
MLYITYTFANYKSGQEKQAYSKYSTTTICMKDSLSKPEHNTKWMKTELNIA